MSSSLTDVVMPKMGISVSEGTVVEWLKHPGDPIEAEETICEVTTDKIDVEIPAPAAGRLGEILVEAGTTVAVGEAIARIEANEGHASSNGVGPAETVSGRPDRGQQEIDRSSFFSPVVRRIAAKHDVDLSSVEGHGIGGRVRKRDLLEHLEQSSAEPALHSDSPYAEAQTHLHSPPEASTPPEAEEGAKREAMSPMRRSIAEHMRRSLDTAAHCTTVVEVDFAATAARRAAERDAMAERGVKLTYLAYVAEAVIRALEEFPVLNASVDGEQLTMHDEINLGIAVSLEDGLVVPVIAKAQRLSLEGLAAAIGDLAERARAGALEPDDVAGGTFTITNPGQFGAVIATPIINQPQVAILDLEAVVERAVVIDGAIAIRPVAYLPMSWDHRALDGATAARFLGRVKQRLEQGGPR